MEQLVVMLASRGPSPRKRPPRDVNEATMDAMLDAAYKCQKLALMRRDGKRYLLTKKGQAVARVLSYEDLHRGQDIQIKA
jgi:hypothetical protein